MSLTVAFGGNASSPDLERRLAGHAVARRIHEQIGTGEDILAPVPGMG